MRAAATARGQGGKPPRASPRATEATRPLTGRCGRYHEESVAEQQGSTGIGCPWGSFSVTTGCSSPKATFIRSERSAQVLRVAGARALAVAPSPHASPAAGRLGWVGGSPFADLERNATTGLGIAQPSTHNATPKEDYRTALLSDSPDVGVRYAGGRG